MNWGEKLADWGWGLVLIVVGGVGTAISRWISMLHKHEKHLILLQAEQATRTTAVADIGKSLTALGVRLDDHRKESADRMDALRRDLRDDFKTLIEFHSRQDERDSHR